MLFRAFIRFWSAAFIQDRRGVAGITVAISFSVMVVMFLAGLDMMRVHMVRSRVWSALDAAALASGRDLGSSTAGTEGAAYFKANVPDGYLGSSFDAPTFTELPTSAGDTMTVTTTVTVPLYSLADATGITFTMKVKALRVTRPTEAVLALDNTGSMADNNKMTNLKSAASTLIDTLLGTSSTNTSAAAGVYVGLVPFTEAVKVGVSSTTKSWLSSVPSSWSGCLFERKSGTNFTFDATTPTKSSFTPYYDTTCTTAKNGTTTCSSSSTWSSGCASTKASTMFLSGDAASMKTAVSNMTAKGSTLIASGLLWGWRMLSPDWQGLWGTTGLPESFTTDINGNTANITKALILLTDGDNCVNSGSPYTNPYGNPKTVAPYGNILSSNNQCAGVDTPKANTLLADACTAAKAAGMTVYTISFGSDISDTSKSLLQNCASQSSYYFNAPTAATLQSSFSYIAGTLSELRLIE
ncbi:MAG TPA: pilus assembly protein TadG-related protein [Candidatus Sulfotelmatobacter sp.]|jgi:Flp pilus assembly protein TadG|nr:pilus assembly protein TadG-related protein [Candidatus Sulfotelmatobacter sp.]